MTGVAGSGICGRVMIGGGGVDALTEVVGVAGDSCTCDVADGVEGAG